MPRVRTTWNFDRLRQAASSKRADPYLMNQDHVDQQPKPDAYVTGTPSTFGEDVHPSTNTWKAEYQNGEVKRNEIGAPEMRRDTFNHPEKTAADATKLAVRKANIAERVSRRLLGKMATEDDVFNHGLSLMTMPDSQLIELDTRLAQQEEQGEEGQQKQAQMQQAQQQMQQAQEQCNAALANGDMQAMANAIQAMQAIQAQMQQQGYAVAQGQPQQAPTQQAQQQMAPTGFAVAQQPAQVQANAAPVAAPVAAPAPPPAAAVTPAAPAAAPAANGAMTPQSIADLVTATMRREFARYAQQQAPMAQGQQQMAQGQQPMQQGQQMAQGQMEPEGFAVADQGMLGDDALLNEMLEPDQGVDPLIDLGIEMDPSMMDTVEAQLGPEDAMLMALQASNPEVQLAQAAKNAQEGQQAPDESQQQQHQANLRTASSRTVGTRPTTGVSRVGGAAPTQTRTASAASDVERLSSLWASAPDVRDHFRS